MQVIHRGGGAPHPGVLSICRSWAAFQGLQPIAGAKSRCSGPDLGENHSKLLKFGLTMKGLTILMYDKPYYWHAPLP